LVSAPRRIALLVALIGVLAPATTPAAEPAADASSYQSAYQSYRQAVEEHDLESAVVHARRAYKRGRKQLGPDDLQTGTLAFNLGAVSLRLSRYRDAIDPLEDASRIYAIHYGPDDEHLVPPERLLGEASQGLERWDSAERHYVRAVDIVERTRGREDPELGALLIELVRVADELGEHQRTRAYGYRAIHVLTKTRPDDPTPLGLLHVRLAGNELRLGDAKQAAKHMDIAIEILKERLKEDDPRWGPVYVVAAQTYAYVGKPSSARKYKRQASELGYEVPEPEEE
jgi:tetratricopeptide (TPR) repeat protein